SAGEGLGGGVIGRGMKDLEGKGGSVRIGHELRELAMTGERVAALKFGGDDTVALGPADAVVLAVPPRSAASLLPGLKTPTKFRALVNAHFRFDPPKDAPPLLGVIGGPLGRLFAFPHPPSGPTRNRRLPVRLPPH